MRCSNTFYVMEAQFMGDLSTTRSSALGLLRLFPQATTNPAEGDEHKDNTANDKLFHNCPSLVS
jgi:hypothetical protein